MKYHAKTVKEAIEIMIKLREMKIPFTYDRAAFIEACRRENPELATRVERFMEKYSGRDD